MMLEEDMEDADASGATEPIDNRSTRLPVRMTSTTNSPKPKLATPLSKTTKFSWENHLNNEYFSQWLLKYVIPDEYQIKFLGFLRY